MRLRFDEFALRSAMWTILEENSTPMVCEDKTLPGACQLHVRVSIKRRIHIHSLFTNRCSRHDLGSLSVTCPNTAYREHLLASTARS
jgi:hypothetical protein